MQFVEDSGIFLPSVMRTPHISVVGLTVTSDTLKAPRKGWPLRLSSFLEMLKQGTPLIEVTSASAMRERALLFMLENTSSMSSVLWHKDIMLRRRRTDFIDPGLHVAVDGDDLLAAIRRSSHAEFSLVTIGWIGRIFRAAIQEHMIKMPGYQFFSAYARRAGRQVSIADACAGTDG